MGEHVFVLKAVKDYKHFLGKTQLKNTFRNLEKSVVPLEELDGNHANPFSHTFC